MLGDLVTPWIFLFWMYRSPQCKVLLGGHDWQLASLFCKWKQLKKNKQKFYFDLQFWVLLVPVAPTRTLAEWDLTHRGLRQWCQHKRVLFNYFEEQYFIDCLVVKQGSQHCLIPNWERLKGEPKLRGGALLPPSLEWRVSHLDRLTQPWAQNSLCF